MIKRRLPVALLLTLWMQAMPAAAAEPWEHPFGELLAAKKFDEALGLLADPAFSESPAAAQQRGFLLGSGLLSSGVDRCGAVMQLETAYEAGDDFVRGTLDYLYGGDWAGIAALEGNHDALLLVGERILDSTIQDNALLAFNPRRKEVDAYAYIYNSALLGNETAKEHYLMTSAPAEKYGLEAVSADVDFQSILCPLRDDLRK